MVGNILISTMITKIGIFDAPHFDSPIAFESNHVMVNRFRITVGKRPLRRSRSLDDLATKHALAMSVREEVFHSQRTIDELRKVLNTTGPVGENVHCGQSVQCIQEMIEFDSQLSESRINVVSDEFSDFGMGTAIGSEGQLYMCQLFR